VQVHLAVLLLSMCWFNGGACMYRHGCAGRVMFTSMRLADATGSEDDEGGASANRSGASRARQLTRKLQQLEESLESPLPSTGLLGYVCPAAFPCSLSLVCACEAGSLWRGCLDLFLLQVRGIYCAV
jgi:hypothetical protein